MAHKVFISADLAASLEDPLFIDCRYYITNPNLGYEQYLQNHISNAIFAHLDQDLSAPLTPNSGRHPLPDINKFHQWLCRQGISPDLHIIVYDSSAGGIAARLWWMLTQLGYPHVFILEGGINSWIARKLPTDDNPVRGTPVSFDLSISSWNDGPYKVLSLEDIESWKGVLVDSRAPERYHGYEEPYDPIPGRIPGAKNLFWQTHVADDLHLKDRESIIENIHESTGTDRVEDMAIYCGSGVTACFNLAIFEHLSLPKPSYYPGSYSEWVRNNPDKIESDK